MAENSDTDSLNENDLLHDPFVRTCEEFIQEFGRLLPDERSRPHGQYEQCLDMAFGRIEALPDVESVNIKRFTFLVSKAHQLGVFTSCVRQQGIISVSTYLRVDHFFMIFKFFPS